MRGTPPHSSSCARRPERRHQLLEGNGAATGRRAYEAVPEGLRARVVGLSLQHQASHGSPGQRRPGGRDLASDDPRDLPGAIRPIASIRCPPARSGRLVKLSLLRDERDPAYVQSRAFSDRPACPAAAFRPTSCSSREDERSGRMANLKAWRAETLRSPLGPAVASCDRFVTCGTTWTR